jgi:hypothetical protein
MFRSNPSSLNTSIPVTLLSISEYIDDNIPSTLPYGSLTLDPRCFSTSSIDTNIYSLTINAIFKNRYISTGAEKLG